jgi:hypothetical protein
VAWFEGLVTSHLQHITEPSLTKPIPLALLSYSIYCNGVVMVVMVMVAVVMVVVVR